MVNRKSEGHSHCQTCHQFGASTQVTAAAGFQEISKQVVLFNPSMEALRASRSGPGAKQDKNGGRQSGQYGPDNTEKNTKTGEPSPQPPQPTWAQLGGKARKRLFGGYPQRWIFISYSPDNPGCLSAVSTKWILRDCPRRPAIPSYLDRRQKDPETAENRLTDSVFKRFRGHKKAAHRGAAINARVSNREYLQSNWPCAGSSARKRN